MPARVSGLPAGILTVSGTYTQQADGALQIEVGGTSVGSTHDKLQVTGAAASFLGYSAVVAFAAARAPLELLGAVAAGAVLGLVINYFGARILVFRPRG